MKNLIEVKELSKRYKNTQAVDGVSWSLPEGSITKTVSGLSGCCFDLRPFYLYSSS
jgi:ABC-type multidrug transport system ATPase subunit